MGKDAREDQYSVLSEKKRKRKTIEKKMPENWEFGNDADLFKSGLSFSYLTVSRKA